MKCELINLNYALKIYQKRLSTKDEPWLCSCCSTNNYIARLCHWQDRSMTKVWVHCPLQEQKLKTVKLSSLIISWFWIIVFKHGAPIIPISYHISYINIIPIFLITYTAKRTDIFIVIDQKQYCIFSFFQCTNCQLSYISFVV